MIRTVWLAAMCLIAISAVSLGKVAKAPPAPTTGLANVQGVTVDVAPSEPTQPPLIKADRLQINLVRQKLFDQPLDQPLGQPSNQSTAPPVDPAVQESETVAPPTGTEIVDRHRREPKITTNKITNRTAKPQATGRTVRKEKPATDPRDSLAADHSRPTGQSRRCDQTTVLGGLLRSLSLQHCGS